MVPRVPSNDEVSGQASGSGHVDEVKTEQAEVDPGLSLDSVHCTEYSLQGFDHYNADRGDYVRI